MQKIEGQGQHEGTLLGVGSSSVASFNVFVVIDGPLPLSNVFQFLHKLASVSGVNTVVTSRRSYKDGWVVSVGINIFFFCKTEDMLEKLQQGLQFTT